MEAKSQCSNLHSTHVDHKSVNSPKKLCWSSICNWFLHTPPPPQSLTSWVWIRWSRLLYDEGIKEKERIINIITRTFREFGTVSLIPYLCFSAVVLVELFSLVQHGVTSLLSSLPRIIRIRRPSTSNVL